LIRDISTIKNENWKKNKYVSDKTDSKDVLDEDVSDEGYLKILVKLCLKDVLDELCLKDVLDELCLKDV